MATSYAQALITLGNTSIYLFLIPHLKEQGFSAVAGGWTAMALALTGVITVVSFGRLADRLPRKRLLMLVMALQGIGLLTFAFVFNVVTLALFVVTLAA